jgi:hypothetical protein
VQEHRHTWLTPSKQDPSGLHLATFGTWVHLSQRVAQTVGGLLEDEPDRCLELFAATDTELVGLLAGAGLADILHAALYRRNNWSGHGGVPGERIQRERLSDLRHLLEKTRAILDWSFEPWTLLKPGQMLLKGGVFDLTATILKGANPAFLRKQVQVTEALDASRLYLLANGSTRALALVPFIRVHTSASGHDACYFYSRLENSTVRWVSYHFQAEPDLVSSDDELAGLLARLAPPDAPRRQATGTRPVPQQAPLNVHESGQQPNGGRPLYEHCQRCGYPFGRLTTQKVCNVRAACDRRLQEPGYRVPEGREQNLTIREATITAHPELGPRPR